METRSDNVRSFAYAIGVHVLCLAIAFSGMFWMQSSTTVQAAGEPIEAVFIDMGTVIPAAPPKPAAPAPAPTPVPPAPPPTPPAPTPTDQTAQDTVEQQEIDRMALLKAEEDAREREEKRKRAEQILLEEEQKKREEEERKREEQQRVERQKAEQEAKAKADREAAEKAEREAAEKAAREAAAAAAAAAQAGNRGEDNSLLARYGAAITRAVHSQWRVAENRGDIVCTLRIIQIPGGEILDAAVVNPCNADDAVRSSLERAARAAEPLPYAGFESVFRREVLIKFCHPEGLPECSQ